MITNPDEKIVSLRDFAVVASKQKNKMYAAAVFMVVELMFDTETAMQALRLETPNDTP